MKVAMIVAIPIVHDHAAMEHPGAGGEPATSEHGAAASMGADAESTDQSVPAGPMDHEAMRGTAPVDHTAMGHAPAPARVATGRPDA